MADFYLLRRLGRHRLVVGRLLHDLAVDLVLEVLELVAEAEDGQRAVDVAHVLGQRHVSHVAHDAGEALGGQLVQLVVVQPEERAVDTTVGPLDHLDLE